MPAGDVYGGGSPTGNVFYENGALGAGWEGMFLACEAGQNVVFGYFPKLDKAGFKLERFSFMTTNQEGEFGVDVLWTPTKQRPKRDLPSDLKLVDAWIALSPDSDWADNHVLGHSIVVFSTL